MKHILRTVFLLLGLNMLAPSALAQEFKLGVVRLDRIIKEAVIYRDAEAKLEQEFSKRDKELQAQSQAVKSLAEQLERDGPTLSELQRVGRQKQLADAERDFQRRRREFTEDLNARRNEEVQILFERANRVVRQVAESEQYDLILQEVAYVNPKHDITDKVIKALNASVGK